MALAELLKVDRIKNCASQIFLLQVDMKCAIDPWRYQDQEVRQ